VAEEVREHNVATVALAPGFMRTERVMAHASGEMDWRKIPWLKKSESPEYIGRAVAALAGDRQVMRKTGKTLHVGELAREYLFNDIDGRRVPPFRIVEPFVNMVKRFEKMQRKQGPKAERRSPEAGSLKEDTGWLRRKSTTFENNSREGPETVLSSERNCGGHPHPRLASSRARVYPSPRGRLAPGGA
jgi:hypothetical protein